MGRVVVDPDYRGDGHSLLMGLVAQCWLSMRTRGYSTAIGATTRRLIALLEALGFPVEVLGPPRTYWGEERYPIFCGGRPAVSELKGEWLIPEVHNLPPDGKTGADPPKEPGETA
jgi:hypothetical protein